ncbi:hypothetical protein ONZ45_g7899 [Pleurotus djamor]|nr:hypothetical protein ONZ45_g7899 [Pleurotus djamor]
MLTFRLRDGVAPFTSRCMGAGIALEPKTVWDVWVGVAWSCFTGFGPYTSKYISDLVSPPPAFLFTASETEHDGTLLLRKLKVIFDDTTSSRYVRDAHTLHMDGDIHFQITRPLCS